MGKRIYDPYKMDYSFTRTQNGTEKRKDHKYHPGNVFTIEYVIDILKERHPELEEYQIRNICYLQFFTLHQIIAKGDFYEAEIPAMGKLKLRPIYRKLKRSHLDIHDYAKKWKYQYKRLDLDSYGFNDPFLKEPYRLHNRGVMDNGVKNQKITCKHTKTKFKVFDELGQRYYVLDSKPTT